MMKHVYVIHVKHFITQFLLVSVKATSVKATVTMFTNGLSDLDYIQNIITIICAE